MFLPQKLKNAGQKPQFDHDTVLQEIQKEILIAQVSCWSCWISKKRYRQDQTGEDCIRYYYSVPS
jgi:hypothetical protein